MKIISDTTTETRVIKVQEDPYVSKSGSDLTGIVFFENGQFKECRYYFQHKIYDFEDWQWLGELSQFIQEIQYDYDVLGYTNFRSTLLLSVRP